MTVKTLTNDEERMRRLLFCLVASFGLSSWVIDFGARSTLFIIPATVAAFHRQIMKRWERDRKITLEELEQLDAGEAEFKVQQAQRQPFDQRKEDQKRKKVRSDLENIAFARPPISWKKLSLLDFILMYGAYKITMKFWIYIVDDGLI